MNKFVFAALAAATALSTPAFAQEEAPFTGPHVEALIGYDRLSVPNDGTDDGADGVLYGIGLGYDFQLGGLIAGIEGEISDSTTKIGTNNSVLAGDTLRLNTDRDLYVGARLGGAISPNTMLYAKGGYTNARIETRYTNAGTTNEFGNTLDGWRIGAGIEHKMNLFGPSGFVKAEYRYSNYGNLNYAGQNIDIDLDRHQAVLGVGIRF